MSCRGDPWAVSIYKGLRFYQLDSCYYSQSRIEQNVLTTFETLHNYALKFRAEKELTQRLIVVVIIDNLNKELSPPQDSKKISGFDTKYMSGWFIVVYQPEMLDKLPQNKEYIPDNMEASSKLPFFIAKW